MNCNGNCLDCEFDECIKHEQFDFGKSARNRRYYLAHKDEENTRSKEYAKSHRAQINARKRAVYNPEKRRKYYDDEKKREIFNL